MKGLTAITINSVGGNFASIWGATSASAAAGRKNLHVQGRNKNGCFTKEKRPAIVVVAASNGPLFNNVAPSSFVSKSQR